MVDNYQVDTIARLVCHAKYQLDSYLPHIDYIGDELVYIWSNEKHDDTLIRRVANFVWATMHYVNNRPQILRDGDMIILRGMTWYEMGIESYEQLQDKEKLSNLLSKAGTSWARLGDVRKALKQYKRALEIDREIGNKRGEITRLTNIGSAWQSLGNLEKALKYYEQTQPLIHEIQDGEGLATALNNIGTVWQALDNSQRALEFHEKALAVCNEIGSKSSEAAALSGIGYAWAHLDDGIKALEYYNRALEIDREIGNKRGEATTLNNIAFVYFKERKVDKAIKIQLEVIDIFHQTGSILEEAAGLLNIGYGYEHLRQFDDALDAVKKGKAIMDMYDLVIDAGGNTIEDYENFLAELRGEAPPNSSASTLPDEVIRQFAGNTAGVKTESKEHTQGWISQLKSIRDDFESKQWKYEIEWVEALLAILQDKPVHLQDKHPYYNITQQIINAIATYEESS
ncbi:MAG: tetratricopeptide repeat protein [Chloroflexota bacterium]